MCTQGPEELLAGLVLSTFRLAPTRVDFELLPDDDWYLLVRCRDAGAGLRISRERLSGAEGDRYAGELAVKLQELVALGDREPSPLPIDEEALG